MNQKPDVLEAPERPLGMDLAIRWLAGEGAGSWFLIKELEAGVVSASRFSPAGKLECSGEFQTKQELDLSMPYTIGYPSHCQTITLIQNNHPVELTRILD